MRSKHNLSQRIQTAKIRGARKKGISNGARARTTCLSTFILTEKLRWRDRGDMLRPVPSMQYQLQSSSQANSHTSRANSTQPFCQLPKRMMSANANPATMPIAPTMAQAKPTTQKFASRSFSNAIARQCRFGGAANSFCRSRWASTAQKTARKRNQADEPP